MNSSLGKLLVIVDTLCQRATGVRSAISAGAYGGTNSGANCLIVRFLYAVSAEFVPTVCR